MTCDACYMFTFLHSTSLVISFFFFRSPPYIFLSQSHTIDLQSALTLSQTTDKTNNNNTSDAHTLQRTDVDAQVGPCLDQPGQA